MSGLGQSAARDNEIKPLTIKQMLQNYLHGYGWRGPFSFSLISVPKKIDFNNPKRKKGIEKKNKKNKNRIMFIVTTTFAFQVPQPKGLRDFYIWPVCE